MFLATAKRTVDLNVFTCKFDLPVVVIFSYNNKSLLIRLKLISKACPGQ